MNSSSNITHRDRNLATELKAISPIARFPEASRPYLPDAGLIRALKVSLKLERPLLITGEPGTGKTQFAFWLGARMECATEKFEAKSTSTGNDLFYKYDMLGRLHATHLYQKDAGPEIHARDYITYEALGLAILRSHNYEAVKSLLPHHFEPWSQGIRTVVLIDEIDKAPRDFPNDLLNELEEMYFKVPEIGQVKKVHVASNELRPIVVITSNSEKGLPAAFLRRCIYYDIPFPKEAERLTEIILAHDATYDDPDRPWIREAIDFFLELRNLPQRLEKKPSTAELLDWLAYLAPNAANDSLTERIDLFKEAKSILCKTASDQKQMDELIPKWLKDNGGRR